MATELITSFLGVIFRGVTGGARINLRGRALRLNHVFISCFGVERDRERAHTIICGRKEVLGGVSAGAGGN